MDWEHIIIDLLDEGFSQKMIAEELEVSQPTVSRILTGVTTRVEHALGEALIEMHIREVQNE